MAKDSKINTPDNFKGDASQVQKFITSCELYFAANSERYTTDAKKIIFALLYMKGETTGAWKTVFLQEVNGSEEDSNDEEEGGERTGIFPAVPNTPDYGTWKEFKAQIQKEFEHATQEIQSRFDLDSFRQGNMNTTDYVTKFKILISKSKIKGNNAKVAFFQKGLNPALRIKIYSIFTLLEIFEDWCGRATTMDDQWRASNASNSGNWRNRSDTIQVRAANLSSQEYQKYIQKGRYFRCDQIGHCATDSKFHPKNN